MHLSARPEITLLMIGYDDRARTPQELCSLFNDIHTRAIYVMLFRGVIRGNRTNLIDLYIKC